MFDKKIKVAKYSDGTIGRRSIPPEIIDHEQQKSASREYRHKIYETFYKGYPIRPFVSRDRELYTNWIDQALMLPKQCIIPREVMTRFADGLLPGHVYMLYWIGKYNGKNRRIPSYFEYKFGICFEKERLWLAKNGYIADGQLTRKGLNSIDKHIDVIKSMSPDPIIEKRVEVTKDIDQLGSISDYIDAREKPGTLDVSAKRCVLLKSAIKEINVVTRDICKQINIPEQKISIKDFAYGPGLYETHFVYSPLTASGRDSKYPLCLHFGCGTCDVDTVTQFGEIFFLEDGRIGKTRQIYWSRGQGFFIYLGQTKGRLSVKRIDASGRNDSINLYKEIQPV